MSKGFYSYIKNNRQIYRKKIIFIISFTYMLVPLLYAHSSVLESKKYDCGIVVTSQHYATKVGYQILQQGGNAIDAAVAVGYALSVVEPCCGNLGGGGFMLIHRSNNQNIFLNFREKAPLNISTKLYLDKHQQPVSTRMLSGYLAVGVPGTVMGLNTALEQYGTLSLTTVIRPAIKLAEHGFILTTGDLRLINDQLTHIEKQSNIAAIFRSHGRPLQVGERLIQADLARTLKKISVGGTKAFYQGSIANQIIHASQKHGGVLTKQDFLDYTVQWLRPIICQYHGYKVISAPPPSSGGITLCEMLNITSTYPLASLGFHSPQATHYILEAMRFAYADRNRYLGDPDFVHNPVKKLLSRQHANLIRKKITEDSASVLSKEERGIPSAFEKPETTHYSIVDQYGNAVSVTYTLNGFFGAKVIPGDLGFFLNNEMDDFTLTPGHSNEFKLQQGIKNRIQPQKRPLSSMTPTILWDQNKLFMVLGAPGGSTIPTQVLQTIENVIDFHFNIKEAVNAPRFHMQGQPNLVYIEPDTFTFKTIQALKRMGYAFHIGSPYNVPHWGAVAAILATTTGKKDYLTGAIDIRRPQGSVMGCKQK